MVSRIIYAIPLGILLAFAARFLLPSLELIRLNLAIPSLIIGLGLLGIELADRRFRRIGGYAGLSIGFGIAMLLAFG